MINLILGGQKVGIDAGELVSYMVDGHEYIHQKGSPGWRNSDTEMFPIIGPTQNVDFRVETPRGTAIQDQHGLLREMEYQLLERMDHNVTFHKKYTAGTPLKNSKFPQKSTEGHVSWPYDFEFRKSYSLYENGLKIVFEVRGEEGMPYMLGYHPAFRLEMPDPTIKVGERSISLQQVMEVGSRALSVPHCDSLELSDTRDLTIGTKGFGNFMLWTEVPNMVCIEPITFYPYDVGQGQLHQGFKVLGKKAAVFEVTLYPNGQNGRAL